MPQQNDLTIQPLSPENTDRIVELAQLLNPSVSPEELAGRLIQQWGFDGYHIFGLLKGEDIIGIASAWVTVRLYGGKLVEIDNVIVAPEARGGGVGSHFLESLQSWAREEGCGRMELKTYVGNARSHKFYFGHGFDLRAFYFVKEIDPGMLGGS